MILREPVSMRLIELPVIAIDHWEISKDVALIFMLAHPQKSSPYSLCVFDHITTLLI